MKNNNIAEALIIDDDVDTCVLLNRILKEKNIKTTYVNSLAEARRMFETYHPLIIFLDNNLPDGFGLEFIPVVKERFPKVHIIMITAHDIDITRKSAMKSGVVFFIPKPFKSDEIHTAIDHFFDNRS
jgi:DNA-binding NtrC family response regulator